MFRCFFLFLPLYFSNLMNFLREREREGGLKWNVIFQGKNKLDFGATINIECPVPLPWKEMGRKKLGG